MSSGNSIKPPAITAVAFEGVCKRFDAPADRARAAVCVLDEVSFACPPGRITCLLGPSGCGKTTTLRLAAGLERPDAGRIVIDGGGAGADHGGGVGMVSQGGDLLPWRRIVDNVALGLELQAMRRRQRRRRALEMMQRVALAAETARCYPHELSGGMRQRAALARALCPQPALLLMDEPLASLDEPTRHEIQALLVELCAATGLTLLFVTHSVDEAVFLADHLLLMHSGGGRVEALPLELPRPRQRHDEAFGRTLLAVRARLHGRGEETT